MCRFASACWDSAVSQLPHHLHNAGTRRCLAPWSRCPVSVIERMARVLSFSDVYHLFRIRGKPTAARSLLFREARDLPTFPLLAWRKQSVNEIDLEPTTKSPKLWGYGYRIFLVSHLNVYLPSLFTTSSDLFKQRELNLYSKQPIQRSQGLYGEGTMCIYRNKTSATMATSEQTV